MKLNMASGLHPTTMPGWVNVDLPWHGVRSPHVFADAYRLPFPDATFTAVYLGHFLEHVEWDRLPPLGAEIRRVTRPGSTVMSVGPDIERATAQGEPGWLLDSITDLNGGPGGHKWAATEALTVDACRLLGLSAVAAFPIGSVTVPDWPNPTCASWQCAVTAVAP